MAKPRQKFDEFNIDRRFFPADAFELYLKHFERQTVQIAKLFRVFNVASRGCKQSALVFTFQTLVNNILVGLYGTCVSHWDCVSKTANTRSSS